MLHKIKCVYLLWFSVIQHLPKTQRHSLGQRIDDLFVETIEMVATAAFLTREQKSPFVRAAIRKLDTLKLMLMILWETRSLDNSKYISLSALLEEIGRMAGGWYGQLMKQNSSGKIPEEK
jgi:hypothetical protein